MPNYNFRNKNTNDVFVDFMSIAEKDEYLKLNPHIEQLVSSFSLGDPIRLGLRKPDDGFRDVLRNIKKHHPLGNAINTF